MSRTELINAICDLFGYGQEDFASWTKSEIWWYLNTPEKLTVTEYVRVNRELSKFELV